MEAATEQSTQRHEAGSNSIPFLVAGTMVTTDLTAARRFYEEFLGFECVRYAADRMLIRDRYAAAEMARGGDDFFVIDVQQVPEVTSPQRLLHHWGLDVVSTQEVDRVHAEAEARKEQYGLTKVMPPSNAHGAYSFYFSDRDFNWWEIECRPDGLDNEAYFIRGDVGSEQRAAFVPEAHAKHLVDDAVTAPRDGIVGNARMTHGTCEQLKLEPARRFIEQVLGIRCVHHVPPGQMLAGRGSFGVFCIGLPRLKPQQEVNRWIISVSDAAAVQAVASRAQAEKEALAIREVRAVRNEANETAVTLQDADGNWWEVTTRQPQYYRDLFVAGDIS
jgi:catechol 2,3-dioxygenase-like lactoylglutathione lyase family enzyme